MCTILLGYRVFEQMPLVLAANRDEFYRRPAQRLGFWDDEPEVLAGRDLEGGGTWLGVSRQGRFAALTNFRDPKAVLAAAPSRGELVRDYLANRTSHQAFVERLTAEGDRYSGFNLLFGTLDNLFYYANLEGTPPRPLTPGYHGLSNHFLNTPWPKVAAGTASLKSWRPNEPEDHLFELLSDARTYPDAQLPDTGVPLEWERLLSSLYIESEVYGSRVASVVLFHHDRRLTIEERSYGKGDGPHDPRRFRMEIATNSRNETP